MHNYDFRTLNDKEFEAISIDLLSCELGRKIERFKPGKDQGVDGRYFMANESEAIIQCKHYLKSGFKALLKKLKNEELGKVKQLNPEKYIITTSIELSRHQKKEIKEAFKPYIVSDADIYGQEDLNSLLARHPNVEKNHYKLWLTSSTVLMAIMNKAITGRSRHLINEAQADSHKYVETMNHNMALDKIKETHAVILTGEPGIGKTTLAKNLCLYYAGKEFQIISIEDSISEAENIYTEDKHQLFYYDDFLGRNYLTAIDNRADSHIVNFIRRVQKDKTKRFILTSRTNILNQGKRLSDLLGESNIEKNELEVRVENINRKDKAKILYNHIYFSNLSEDFIEEVYLEKRYLSIIDHKNFNPRLIEFITNKDKASGLDSKQYWQYITETLDNPVDIWEKAFEVQIDEYGRNIVSLIVMNGGTIDEEPLQNAFHSMSELHQGAQPSTISTDFSSTVRPLSMAMLNRNLLQETNKIDYDLFNPSIGDYVLRRISKDKIYLAELFYSLGTSRSLRNLEDIYRNKIINKKTFCFILKKLSKKLTQKNKVYDEYSFLLASILIDNQKNVDEKFAKKIITDFSRDINLNTLMVYNQKIFLELIYFTLNLKFRTTWHSEISEYVVDNINSFWEHDEFMELCYVVDQLNIDDKENLLTEVKERIIEYWKNNFHEYITEEGTIDSILNEDEIPFAKTEISDLLDNYFTDYLIIFDNWDKQEICDTISIEDIIDDNRQRAAAEAYQEELMGSSSSTPDTSENDFIDDLFYREK